MSKPFLLEFEINALPKTLNQLFTSHWRARHEHNKMFFNLVALNVKNFKPQMPLEEAKLTFTRVASRAPDFDNLVGSFKCIIDALVRCGIIAGDTPQVIGQPVYLFEKSKRSNGKIKIKVESPE
jgi:Holliday junction resolvase RusA-like endonuclease